MNSTFTVVRGKTFTFSVTMNEKEYVSALKAVPLEGQLQGLEHSGSLSEQLARLSMMAGFLSKKAKKNHNQPNKKLL